MRGRPVTAGEILQHMVGVVSGERNQTHGEKERSFSVIASLWNAYIDGKREPGPLSARDVAQMMVLQKMARSIQGEPIEDHFADQCGYSAIAGECAAAEQAATRPTVADTYSRLTAIEHANGNLANLIHDRIAETETEPVWVYDGKGVRELPAACCEGEQAVAVPTGCGVGGFSVQEGDTPETGDRVTACAFIASKG